MSRLQILLLALTAVLLGAPRADAQPTCRFEQITASPRGTTGLGLLDGGSIAFSSSADPTGGNPDGNPEIFLYDGAAITQITDTTSPGGPHLYDFDDGSIVFSEVEDLTGGNPDRSREIFLFDGDEIVQITDSTLGASDEPSLDGGSIAFSSTSDLTGGNPDHSKEIFLFDGSSLHQVTDFARHSSAYDPSLDDGSIAFVSTGNVPDAFAERDYQLYLFDGSAVRRLTDTTTPDFFGSFHPDLQAGSIAFNDDGIRLYDGSSIRRLSDFGEAPSLDRGSIAFYSLADPFGENPEHSAEIYLFHAGRVHEITRALGQFSFEPSLDGSSIAFVSTADLTGENPEHRRELFLATCDGLQPAPPAGPYLATDELPGFRFKVRITAGERVFAGQKEDDCLGETLCVSGALPGRSELFLRIIGPRPNGFLWTNLVRFTPSRVEVWVEQTSTGLVEYYDLPALPRQDTELTGLVDQGAFPGSSPDEGNEEAAPQARARRLGSTGVTGISFVAPRRRCFRIASSSRLGSARVRPVRAAARSCRADSSLGPKNRPAPRATFVPAAFPGYRFTVRILSGDQEQPTRVESRCVPETVCVSGALPGRTELLLRIIGPRPNGFLWVSLVRFTTSRVEVEVERLATGTRRTYVLDQIPHGSEALPGRVDKGAFRP
jgi:hypothetical protein